MGGPLRRTDHDRRRPTQGPHPPAVTTGHSSPGRSTVDELSIGPGFRPHPLIKVSGTPAAVSPGKAVLPTSATRSPESDPLPVNDRGAQGQRRCSTAVHAGSPAVGWRRGPQARCGTARGQIRRVGGRPTRQRVRAMSSSPWLRDSCAKITRPLTSRWKIPAAGASAGRGANSVSSLLTVPRSMSSGSHAELRSRGAGSRTLQPGAIHGANSQTAARAAGRHCVDGHHWGGVNGPVADPGPPATAKGSKSCSTS